MKFYVVAITKSDEFIEGIYDTLTEAVKEADHSHYRLTDHDKKRQIIEVRAYADEDNDDYDIIDWRGSRFFMDFDTGVINSIEEIREMYDQTAHELSYEDFDDYLDKALSLGRQKIGGLIEVE